MDPNLVYIKTASGEEAMRQRTRVVQRNMRMVLILVDGKATVADLCTKTANSQLTESALRDLELGGFIQAVVAQDSVWEQSKQVAQEIRAAALGQPSLSPPPPKRESVRREPAFIPSPPPVFNEVVDSSFSSFSIEPVPHPVRTATNKISMFGVQSVLNLPNAPLVEQTSLLDRLKALLPSKKPRRGDDFSIERGRHGAQRRAISWPLALVFGVLGLGFLVFLAAIFFPYGRYLPEVEAILSQASGQSARIGEMRVAFYPKPGLFLNNVRLGNQEGEQGMRISEMRLLPVLATMTAPRKVFREMELNGVTLPAEALVSLPGIFDGAAQSSAKVGVLHVTLDKADISFRGLTLAGMSGEARLAPDGRFNSLALNSASRGLHLEVKPAAAGVDVELEASGWRPSEASSFVIDSGNIKGNLNGAALTLAKIDLRIFDGLLQGAAVLRADKQPSMVGDISFQRISARRFGEAMGIGPQFEGETTGNMKISATAESWASIFSGVNAEGDFTVNRGVLGGIDLAEAARRASSAPIRGGSTRFESLSGRLDLAPGNYRFSALALNSGLMQSSGQVTVGKNLQVSGRIEVQMRGTVNQLRLPVSMSGTLKAPLLQVGGALTSRLPHK